MREKQSGASAELAKVVERVWNRVPRYRARMESAGVTPNDIRGLENISLLPFTEKSDLRDSYPTGMLACDRSEVVRFHASSGTTGRPTVVAYTRNDVDLWSESMSRCLSTAGVTKDDVIQVAYGYGLFTGGLGLHYGGERLGASVIPASGGFSERQLLLMKDLGTTVLACTPSYALKLSEMIEAGGLRDSLSLRIGIFGAEPWSEGLRGRLESALGITALDVYGLSEVMGPGVGMECTCKNGLHVDDEFFITEIIDPDTGRVLPDGEEGELVLTTLGKEAMPVIRYRTHDITRRIPGNCACGRKGARIARIKGRTDDMLIIRGVNVFPSQVEVALGRVPGLSHHYYMEVSEKEGLKELTVVPEISETVSEVAMRKLQMETVQGLHSLLGVRVNVRLLEPG
ncbi:phenylacetate--CoA ligase, partial [Candidatus Oleimmundimicrobium sp.]|uniref:phenylacetate--CoA ligase family protein n=1 Tax=Candidatus Oleimmundimicrobium sp. TaxID=3060597 RepID=UPI002722D922